MLKQNTELHDYLIKEGFKNNIRGYYLLANELSVSITSNSASVLVNVNEDWRTAFIGTQEEVLEYLKEKIT